MKLSLRALSLSFCLFVSSAVAQAQSPAVHGMVLFGTENLYISHIPMFMNPHDYQALAKVSLSSNGLAAYTQYNAGDQQYFTLAPRPFVLPQLLNGGLTSFRADLYRGSFEQGGRVIASNITVTVEKIEYQSRLSRNTAPASSLTYITLDDGDKSYLAHQITAPNNFDHIVQIKWLNQKPTSLREDGLDNLAIDDNAIKLTNNDGLTAAFPENESFAKSFAFTDHLSNRLQAGQLFTITADGGIEEASNETEASFQVVSDFYCTQGPDFYNPCR